MGEQNTRPTQQNSGRSYSRESPFPFFYSALNRSISSLNFSFSCNSFWRWALTSFWIIPTILTDSFLVFSPFKWSKYESNSPPILSQTSKVLSLINMLHCCHHVSRILCLLTHQGICQESESTYWPHLHWSCHIPALHPKQQPSEGQSECALSSCVSFQCNVSEWYSNIKG